MADNAPPVCPFNVYVCLKTNIDVFMFNVPCSLSVLLVPG